ncbi:coiled-coil domain-containing protein 137 [Dryobates pubescens]|uniref:coiled-coil domain-containing protein 137 n=1 Tax=Dryobates pubescens TaxID=118200 RepID=UPI0023B95396|nr:coiled-coil domain-containing protein 137 [Dryobates pubescens]
MGRGPAAGHGRRQRPGEKSGQGQGQGHAQRPGQKSRQRLGQKSGQGTGAGQKSGQGTGPGPGPKSGQGPGRGPTALRRTRKENKVDNMKPKHPDEQEIPFRLRELMRSREAMKRPDPRKQQVAEKKQQPKAKGTKAQGDIPVHRFRRGKGESERSYMCRMEQEVKHLLFLTKSQVQREPEKEDMAPVKSKRKKEFQNKKLEKARKKKEEKKEAMLEKRRFQDTVAFGEVVTQPPTITSRPRGQGPVKKAGQRQLLLRSCLGQSQSSPAALVSMARRRIVEEERVRVIQAYRDIQRRKRQQREMAQAGSIRAGRRVPC